jgi:hypothetical protein
MYVLVRVNPTDVGNFVIFLVNFMCCCQNKIFTEVRAKLDCGLIHTLRIANKE